MHLKCSTKNGTLTVDVTDLNMVVFWENSQMIGSVGLLDLLDAINHSLRSQRLPNDPDLQDLFLSRRLAAGIMELSRTLNFILETRTGTMADQLLNESNTKGGE